MVMAAAVMGWHAASGLCHATGAGCPDVVTMSLPQTSQWLLHVALCLTAFLCVRRHVTLPWAAALIVLAQLLNGSALLHEPLNAVLQASMPGYADLFGREQSSPNPQIPKMLLFAVLVPLLWARMIPRRARTLDRLMIAIAVTSLLTTTVIFHQIIVEGSYARALEAHRTQMLDALRHVADLEAWCAERPGVLCVEANRADPTGRLPAALPSGTADLVDHLAALPDPVSSFAYTVFNGNDPTTLESEDTHSVVAIAIDGARLRIAYDPIEPTEINRIHVIWFSALAVFAHSVWLLGALGLLTWHRRRFARRASVAQRRRVSAER